MDRNDVTDILERLSAHYQKEIDPATAHAWYESLHALPKAAADMAFDTVTRTNKWMPNATEFRQATTAEARDLIRNSHHGNCGQCVHSWIEGNDGFYPCPSCAPDVHHQWESVWAPEIRRRRGARVNEDSRLEADPVAGIENARFALGEAF